MILAPAFHDPGAAQDGAGIVVIIDDISRFARHIESHWTLRGTPKDLGGKLESPSINFGEDSDSVLIENMLASVSQHQRQKNAEQTRNRMRARAISGYWCYGDARVFVARRHAAVAPVAAGADHARNLNTPSRAHQRGARVAYCKDLNLDFPLRGFVLCAGCDGPLASCWSKPKTGKKHPYYMCFTKGCKSYRKSIRKAQSEGDFGKLMQEVAPSAAVLSVTRHMFTDIWDARLAQTKDHAAFCKRKAADIDKQVNSPLTRLVDATESRVIGAYETKIARLEEEKLVLEEKAAGSGHPQRPFAQMFELAMQFLSSPWKI